MFPVETISVIDADEQRIYNFQTYLSCFGFSETQFCRSFIPNCCKFGSDENRVFYDFTEGRGSCGPCNLDDTFPECNDRVFAAGHIGIASPAILPDISTRGLLGFRKVNYLSQRVVGNSFSPLSSTAACSQLPFRSPPRLIALEFTESG